MAAQHGPEPPFWPHSQQPNLTPAPQLRAKGTTMTAEGAEVVVEVEELAAEEVEVVEKHQPPFSPHHCDERDRDAPR